MRSKRNWIGGAILLTLMAVTFWTLLRDQPLTQIKSVMGQLKPGWLVGGLCLMMLMLCSEAACTRQILPRLGYRTTLRRCLGYSFVGFYFSAVTPSATGGQPAQIYCMTKDGVSAAHLRHKIGIYESTLEYLEVGRRTGAKIQISHLASAVPEAFEAARKAIEEEGIRARIDTIPNSVGHCTGKERMLLFTMALSDELFSQGIEGVKKALHTPEGRALILQDNYTFGGGKDKVYIVHSDDPHLENRSVRDIARERGIDENECMLDLMGDDNNYVFWLNAPAANVPSNFIDHCDSIIANPYVSVGSDTIMGDIKDPFDWYEIRRRGGFAIFAQMYLKKGVPYEEIVRRNTSMVADHFGIKGRGRLEEGCYADIAVIDLPRYRYPEMSQEQYKTPRMCAEGCDLVLVNGRPALRDGEVLSTYPGRVLRKNAQ